MPADAGALARALAELGLACEVEADGALAILVPRAPTEVPGAEMRAAIVLAARAAGFASVAFELPVPVEPVDSPRS